MITVKQFSKLFPHCIDPNGWVNEMVKVFPKYNITSKKRYAAFIAQCGHESGGWRVFEENLNYSAESLNKVFPKYFMNAGRDAKEYHRQPEKIANIVYANRMGNTNAGDGWEFRGRGPIQLTGRNNYLKFSKDLGLPEIMGNPDLVANNKEIALLSALWFWDKHNLNTFADNSDIKGMTKIINGGYNGLDDRIHHFNNIMNNSFDTIIKKGSTGEGVKLIQNAIGLIADGVFGPNTESAVKEWQKNNGLVADGIVGPKTLKKLIG